jgi:hypothetical protein
MKITIERTPTRQIPTIDNASENASASTTATYYNGGVEGPAFANWYQKVLALHVGRLPPIANRPGLPPKAKTSVVRVERCAGSS